MNLRVYNVIKKRPIELQTHTRQVRIVREQLLPRFTIPIKQVKEASPGASFLNFHFLVYKCKLLETHQIYFTKPV